MQKQNIGPVLPQERIQTIDILRALALLGVVIANFTVDNRYVTPEEGRTWFFDQLVYWPIRFFIDDKAMAMYCFLFGLGFSIQMLRAESRKAPFVILQMRRLVVLFLIGIVALILTNETIPHEYAIVGMLLLLLYKLSRKILPILAILCVLVPFTRNLINQKKPEINTNKRTEVSVDTTLLNSYTGVYEIAPGSRVIILRNGNSLFAEGPRRHTNLFAISDSEFVPKNINNISTFHKDSNGMINKIIYHSPDGKITDLPRIKTDLQHALKEQLRQRKHGNFANDTTTYKQFIAGNSKKIWNRFKTWSWSDFFWGSDISDILPFFLIGLYAGRRRIFYDVESNKPFLKKVMEWGFILGITGMSINLGFEAWNYINAIYWSDYSPITRSWVNLSWNLGVMAMTFAYAAGLTLLLENVDWKKRLSFLAPVGRMGFTNYLLQTIPYIILFHYGFNLSGKIGPFYRLLLALPVYVSLIFLSRWWFKHFTIGPVEWLWRSLTYLKFQPMRLKASNKNEEKEIESV